MPTGLSSTGGGLRDDGIRYVQTGIGSLEKCLG